MGYASKIKWDIRSLSEEMISQIAELFYDEWDDDIERWLDDVRFYIAKKHWKLAYLREGNQLIGVLIYKHLPLSNSTALSYLIVHRKFRRKGIGTLLMKEIEKRAQYAGNLAIFFDTHEPIREQGKYFFLEKLKYRIVNIPILLPDEPPATYLFIKFLKDKKYLTSLYFETLLKEYVNESYSDDELKRYTDIFTLMLHSINSSNKIHLTKNLFLKKYVDTKYITNSCRELSLEDLEKFVEDVKKII